MFAVLWDLNNLCKMFKRLERATSLHVQIFLLCCFSRWTCYATCACLFYVFCLWKMWELCVDTQAQTPRSIKCHNHEIACFGWISWKRKIWIKRFSGKWNYLFGIFLIKKRFLLKLDILFYFWNLLLQVSGLCFTLWEKKIECFQGRLSSEIIIIKF